MHNYEKFIIPKTIMFLREGIFLVSYPFQTAYLHPSESPQLALSKHAGKEVTYYMAFPSPPSRDLVPFIYSLVMQLVEAAIYL